LKIDKPQLTLRCPGFITPSHVQRGGGKITPRCISSSVAPRKKIPMAIPMFSRSNVSMVQTVMLPEVGM